MAACAHFIKHYPKLNKLQSLVVVVVAVVVLDVDFRVGKCNIEFEEL